MSVRVNLLPRATKESARSTQQRVIAAVLVFLLLAGLTGASLWQHGTLRTAEDELADARQELAAAQAAVAALADYAELERRLDEDRELLVTALGTQVSLAGIMQDLSLVMPAETDLRSLSISLAVVQTEEGVIESVGAINASGESLDGIAPGVERLLIRVDQVAGFRDVFVSSASIDDEDISTFNLDMQLGPEHLTNRYVDGLPRETP